MSIRFSSGLKLRGLRTLCAAALLLAAAPAFAQEAQKLTWPPTLPGGQQVVTDTSNDFLKPPAGVELKAGVVIAKEAPTIDFAFFQGQTHKGNVWSDWGDSLAVGENKFYASIGDHIAPRGTGQVYEYDAQSRELRLLVDIKTWLEESGNLPEGMDYTPGKIHSRIDMGKDGWLYYSTHRGSTRNNTTDERGYKGDWIFKTNPQTGVTEIAASYPVEKHTIPASVLDPERMIYYGGTAAGNDAPQQGVRFLAYDVANGKKLLDVDGGFKRYAIFSSSTGKVFWDGKVYDPATNKITASPEVPEVRSATRETPQGIVYGTTGGSAEIWAFDVKTEKLTKVGDGGHGGKGYTTSIVADPTGRYLYYVPGGHGGVASHGTPVMQFDTQTKTAKVIAFVAQYYQKKYGYTPDGTFGVALNSTGDKLFINWNGNRTNENGSSHWDSCAMMVINIPESERQP